MLRGIDESSSMYAGADSPKTWRPLARPLSEFSICEVGDGEMTLLDVERLEYHTLSASAFTTWRLCDGESTIGNLAVSRFGAEVSDPHNAQTELEVIELHEAGLLDVKVATFIPNPSRRRLLQTAAAAITGGIVLPAVKSITAPDAVSAASNVLNSHPCSPGDTCLSGPTSSGTTGPYCCAFGDSGWGYRCIPENIAGTNACTQVFGLCGNWGPCQ